MSTHGYETVMLQELDWDGLGKRVAGGRIAFSVDLAKDDFSTALMSGPQTVEALVKWAHPQESRALIACASRLAQVALVEARSPC